MSVGLVLAPDMTDSALFLSYPYTNELVNSVVKVRAYIGVGDEDAESFSALGAFGTFNPDLDFRNCLYITTYSYSATGSTRSHGFLWGCRCRFKPYLGTHINCISLADFNVDEFNLVSGSP